MKVSLYGLLILLWLLVGCGTQPSAAPTPDQVLAATPVPVDPAAQAVETYLLAKIASDDDKIRELLCAPMEADFAREAGSFESVQDPRIEAMQCSREPDSDVVRCEGKIIATYGTEAAEFPLTAYRVVQEDGVWKWCGETESFGHGN